MANECIIIIFGMKASASEQYGVAGWGQSSCESKSEVNPVRDGVEKESESERQVRSWG